jgi:hypothetical protein
MNISQAIRCGDPGVLRANEHEILYDVELMLDQCSIENENYITYWIACHRDKEVATEMFEVFMNTCSTAFSLHKYEEIMELYSYPTMVGAIANVNTDIIEHIMGYQGKETLIEEIYAQYGDEEYWPESLLTWYHRTFS